MTGKRLEASQKAVDRMLLTLWTAGYVELHPEPPKTPDAGGGPTGLGSSRAGTPAPTPHAPKLSAPLRLSDRTLGKLLLLRGVNPLYGVFLVNQLGIADRNERIQALESVLELPPSVGYHLHVPGHDQLPPGTAGHHPAGHPPAATGAGHAPSSWARPSRRSRTDGERSMKRSRSMC